MASFLLRPVHEWFFLWEQITPALYRVIAVGVGALVTVVVLVGLELHPLVAVGLALMLWIGLAIAQEHDERVRLPPDPDFVAALTKAVLVPPPGLKVRRAIGPGRARREDWDSLIELTATGESDHPLARHYISVQRNARRGWMEVYVTNDIPTEPNSIQDRLRTRGEINLALRITRSSDAFEDSEAIALALTRAYW